MKTEFDLLPPDGDYKLEVWHNKKRGICVRYKGAETKSGSLLIGEYGVGSSFTDAVNDYYQKIRGKTLVFNAFKDNRTEVRVL